MNSAPNFTPLTKALLAIGLVTAAGLCAADQYEAEDHTPFEPREAGSLGARTHVRAAQRGDGRRLHRRLGLEVPAQLSSALPENPVRSFSEAARENADLRVKAGLHFRFATTAGLEMGRQIGQYVSRNALPRQHGAATQRE